MSTIPGQLTALVGAAQYVPSNRAIRARDEFWKQPGISLPDTLEKSSICALAPSESVRKYIQKQWDTPGFQDWFLAPDWEIEESKRLLNQSIQRIGEILRDEEEPGIVISAAKEAREIWTRLQATKQTKYADEELGKMGPDELREFIRKNSAVVNSK